MEQKNFISPPLIIPDSEKEIPNFLKTLPKSPGVYKFLDQYNTPLYIGKAKLLNQRIRSYFQTSSKSKKIEKLIEEAEFVELSITSTELESLLLEQFLIKEFKPKFNVQFKDDKGYPWIKIDKYKKYPSAKSFLGKKQENGKFYGPFPNSYAVRDALKVVQKTFKLRNCSDSSFRSRKRPCLQYEIGRCSAPCVGLINMDDYKQEVESAELLLEGKSNKLIDEFYELMDKYSLNKDYERAAIYRDRISSIRDIQRSQSITGFKEQRDAIYVHAKSGISKIGVTHVNEGWVTGHQNYLEVEDLFEEDVLEKFILQNYFLIKDCPPYLVISRKLKNKDFIEESLSKHHSKRIKIITRPSKKDKGLLEICKSNTEYSLGNKINKKTLSNKLKNLESLLDMRNPIETIESYDISHHAGEYAVGACVVYSEKGRLKDQSRLYNIDKKNSGNDIASMMELIDRRFNKQSLTKVPSLIIIDGGKTHLEFTLKKFKQLDIQDVKIISISKGARRKAAFDLIHLDNGKSLGISPGSPEHSLIQIIRDETHRLAISRQKKKRSNSSFISSLDSLEGIGRVRKKSLLRYFGSVKQLKRASVNDITNVKGIGKELAISIFTNLHK